MDICNAQDLHLEEMEGFKSFCYSLHALVEAESIHVHCEASATDSRHAPA